MDKKFLNSSLELWGGIECTINRIDDFYLDQLEQSKHFSRENDLDLIASLGIKTLRYPILWEFNQPRENEIPVWKHTDTQLGKLRDLGIKPIAGLLHHGSGPEYTNLLDSKFPEKLASYAELVAERYPWIEFYTPVNEPLTTARFSGLYGLWYPHKQNDISFAKMLLNQVKGIVLSMIAIRKINPSAKLVQTEDLCKTYSTPSLAYQAKFENERRWLTYDLLCGKVTPGHVMWAYLSRLGIPASSLQFFIDNPCPPDIMGLNHYITSERFLDDKPENYPPDNRGGNEVQEYADVEAVRIPLCKRLGLKALLKEAWDRFGLPMAITEAQLNCTREEQLRWLSEIWKDCQQLRKDGIDVKAVTAWSLLGAFGWDTLLTSRVMDYEPGAFDLRSGKLRPTALASLIRGLATGEVYEHPLLNEPGWWQRDVRFNIKTSGVNFIPETSSTPLLIIGKTGTLGKAFARACKTRGIPFVLLGRVDVDITNAEAIELIVKKYSPWAIINAAGFVRVDDAESEKEACFYSNTLGPHLLSIAAKKYSIKLLTFSSDLVFNGEKRHAYHEGDVVNPLNVYGRSKADAEALVLKENNRALIVRSSAFFGARDEYNFVYAVLKTLESNKIFIAADDVFVSPTYVPDLVNVSLDLLIDDENGIWHLTNLGETTWADLAIQVAGLAGLDSDLVIRTPKQAMNFIAPRPAYSVLKSNNGLLLPSIDNALSRFFEERSEYKISRTHYQAEGERIKALQK